jgi:hypothetical protein
MKLFYFLFAFIFLIILKSNAQNTSYFTFNNQYYTIEKIMKTTTNNYVGIAYSWTGYSIFKFDAIFNTVWCKRITKNNLSHPLDIVETNLGNYAFLFDNIDTSFLLKVNTQGVVLNAKYFTSNTINYFTPTNLSNSIINDGIILTGGYCNVENYCIRLDDNLNVMWQYQYRDGIGTCANSRSSDIVSENTRYVFTTNPSSGGIDFLSIGDDGSVMEATNYALPLQIGGYPLQCKYLHSGVYMTTWASANISNGTEYVFIEHNNNKAISRKYNLGFWNYMNEYIEYEPNKIIIGGTNLKLQTSNQTNILHAVDNTGAILWTKTSESLGSAASPSQINTFAMGLDNTVFAFGGSGLDGAFGAKLNFNGNGFCNATNFNSSIIATDSIVGTPRTITKWNLTALVSGNYVFSLVDTVCNRTIQCGILDNAPLAINAFEIPSNSIQLSPMPFSNQLCIDGLSKNASFKVFNLIGEQITNYTISYSNEKVFLGTAELQNGIYFLQIKSNNKILNKKICKQ